VTAGSLLASAILPLLIGPFVGAQSARQESSSRPNILLISLDTLRRDHLHCYGYDRPTSPCVDKLASEGIVFEWCYCQAPSTLPSHRSLMTSLYPNSHKVNLPSAKLAPEKTTVAETLSENGYYTVGIFSNPFLQASFGFDQGFDVYRRAALKFEEHGYEATQALQKWAEEYEREKPLFLFLHYNDPHAPYAPPEGHAKRFDPDYEGDADGAIKTLERYAKEEVHPRDLAHVESLYDDEIRYANEQLSQAMECLEKKGLLDNTIVVFTSDHGEEFKDHGGTKHPNHLYNELIHVPLIMKFPKHMNIPPRRFHGLVKSVDIVPTLLDAVGIAVPQGLHQGRSLMSAIRNPREERRTNEWVFSEAVNTERVAMISKDLKYIYEPSTGKEELYDLAKDPKEKIDLAEEETETCQKLRAVLMEHLSTQRKGWHVRSVHPLVVKGTLTTTSVFEKVEPFAMENQDSLQLNDERTSLRFFMDNSRRHDRLDGCDFSLRDEDGTVELAFDDSKCVKKDAVFLGMEYKTPERLPWTLGPHNAEDYLMPVGRTMFGVGAPQRKNGFLVWKQEDAGETLTTEIDPGTMDKLKSLGYFR